MRKRRSPSKIEKKNLNQEKGKGQIILAQNSTRLPMPTFLNLIHKTETKGTVTNSFYEVTVTTQTKSRSNKENYRPIFLMNINPKILNKTLSNRDPHSPNLLRRA